MTTDEAKAEAAKLVDAAMHPAFDHTMWMPLVDRIAAALVAHDVSGEKSLADKVLKLCDDHPAHFWSGSTLSNFKRLVEDLLPKETPT